MHRGTARQLTSILYWRVRGASKSESHTWLGHASLRVLGQRRRRWYTCFHSIRGVSYEIVEHNPNAYGHASPRWGSVSVGGVC